MKVQRLRFRYRLTVGGSSLSHREIIDALVRAATEAGLALAYSEGKRPSPQISIAALLPAGATSEFELADVYLSRRVEPARALDLIAPSLSTGIEVAAVDEVGLGAPSLQSLVRWAEYEVLVPAEGLGADMVQRAVGRLMAAESFPAEYRRTTKVKRYDLRPLVLSIHVEGERDDCFVLVMRLRAEPEMTARADQVVLALGLPPARSVHRRRLFVDVNQPAVLAHRRFGGAGAN